ncbi:MAG: hypothetical protein EBZ76_11105 [Synechococcaceae bacterium WB9_2_170]|nr:hypothetical protein [Synechococcaceae bacterium WB9_2_170]
MGGDQPWGAQNASPDRAPHGSGKAKTKAQDGEQLGCPLGPASLVCVHGMPLVRWRWRGLMNE